MKKQTYTTNENKNTTSTLDTLQREAQNILNEISSTNNEDAQVNETRVDEIIANIQLQIPNPTRQSNTTTATTTTTTQPIISNNTTTITETNIDYEPTIEESEDEDSNEEQIDIDTTNNLIGQAKRLQQQIVQSSSSAQQQAASNDQMLKAAQVAAQQVESNLTQPTLMGHVRSIMEFAITSIEHTIIISILGVSSIYFVHKYVTNSPTVTTTTTAQQPQETNNHTQNTTTTPADNYVTGITIGAMITSAFTFIKRIFIKTKKK